MRRPIELPNNDAPPSRGPSRLNSIVTSWDFYVGIIAGCATWLLARDHPSLLKQATSLLTTEAFLGAGVLAVVLAAMAVVVTFFGDAYLVVLQRAPDGVSGALFPYRVVAAVGAASAGAALLTTLLWPEIGNEARSALFGLSTGLVAWALTGTYMLVGLTIYHASKRAQLERYIDDARRDVAEARKTQRSA